MWRLLTTRGSDSGMVWGAYGTSVSYAPASGMYRDLVSCVSLIQVKFECNIINKIIKNDK